MSIIITAAELAAALDSKAPPVVLDVRWRLDRPDGRPDYRAGHIPGAVYVDLDRELASHGEATEGRHPLPSIEDLQASARSWGINEGDSVVVYDDLKNLSSARAWWLLSYAGIKDVRLLDGAVGMWTSSDRKLESGDVTPAQGNVTLSYGHLPVLEIDEAARLPSRGMLLDARSAERYRGDVEPVDPKAGHIPGALSAPTTENVDVDGAFRSPAELRGRFQALGIHDVSEVGVYCGSGVTAAHTAAALTIAGYAPALYPGSWSQWSNHPDRPVAMGPLP